MNFKLKSYTEEEILSALARGYQVYALDSANAGEDDTLVGTQSECEQDICTYLECDTLPPDWSLDPITLDVLDERQLGIVHRFKGAFR